MAYIDSYSDTKQAAASSSKSRMPTPPKKHTSVQQSQPATGNGGGSSPAADNGGANAEITPKRENTVRMSDQQRSYSRPPAEAGSSDGIEMPRENMEGAAKEPESLERVGTEPEQPSNQLQRWQGSSQRYYDRPASNAGEASENRSISGPRLPHESFEGVAPEPSAFDRVANALMSTGANETSGYTGEAMDMVNNTLAQVGHVATGALQAALKIGNAPAYLLPEGHPIRDFTIGPNSANLNAANQALDNLIPAPGNAAANVVATVADAVGEAVPAAAISVAMGANPLIGNPLSYTAGAANAFTTEMAQGSGDAGRAAVRAATEWGTEALGGKLFGGVSSALGQAAGEGVEEVISGGVQSALTGGRYTPTDAIYDFALGTTVGGILSSGANAVNTVRGTTQTPDGAQNPAAEANPFRASTIPNNGFGISSDFGSVDPYESLLGGDPEVGNYNIGTIDPYYTPPQHGDLSTAAWDARGTSHYDADIGIIDPYYRPPQWGSHNVESQKPVGPNLSALPSFTGETKIATMDAAALLDELSTPITIDDATWALVNAETESENKTRPAPDGVPEPSTQPPAPAPIVAPTVVPSVQPAQAPVEVPDTNTNHEVEPAVAPAEVALNAPVDVSDPTATPAQAASVAVAPAVTVNPAGGPDTPTMAQPLMQPPDVGDTVAQAAANEQGAAPELDQRRDRPELRQSAPALMGSGATGEVYESTGYNITFGQGILSSY